MLKKILLYRIIVKTENELLECLGKEDAWLLESRGTKADEPIADEKGNACKRVAEFMGFT